MAIRKTVIDRILNKALDGIELYFDNKKILKVFNSDFRTV